MDGVLFVVAYSPKYYPEAIFAGIAYLVSTWWVSRRLTSAARLVALAVELALLLGGAVAYVLYHRGHPIREVQAWQGMERVVPYHEQLAVPFFVTLIFGPLVLIASKPLSKPLASPPSRRREGG